MVKYKTVRKYNVPDGSDPAVIFPFSGFTEVIMADTKDVYAFRRAAFLLIIAIAASCAGFFFTGVDLRDKLIPDPLHAVSSVVDGIGICTSSVTPLLICFAVVLVGAFTPFRLSVSLLVLIYRAVGTGALICAAKSGETGAIISAAAGCACMLCLLSFCAICSGSISVYDQESERMRNREVLRSFLTLSGASVVFSVTGIFAVHFI